MRCDKCPLCPTDEEDSCPISDGEYGLEHKDGMWGCRHSWNWCKKQYEEYQKNIREGCVVVTIPADNNDEIPEWIQE